MLLSSEKNWFYVYTSENVVTWGDFLSHNTIVLTRR